MMDVDLTLVGGTVVVGDGTTTVADVDISGDRIVAVRALGTETPDTDRGRADARIIDARNRWVAPGLIDLQINGGWGHDFTSDPESMSAVAARLPATGVTAFVPTIVTASPERRAAALDAFGELVGGDETAVAAAVGVHFEGPAISPRRVGAHDPGWVGLPEPDELDRWTAQAGVAIVTLAPELDGALALVERLVAQGVIVSIGHTECSTDAFTAARSAGASLVTHLFNAMAPFEHRAPGPIGATLADSSVYAGLICDGVHCDPVAVRIAWNSLGPDRLVLVTDAVAALGLDSSVSHLGSVDVVIDDVSVRLPSGTLAGSKLSLDTAIRNLVQMTGCDPADAIRAASAIPADVLGLHDRGRIVPGARADLAIFSPELNVERTLIGGRTVWKS